MGWAQRNQYPMGSAGPMQVLLALQMGSAHSSVFQSDGLGPALPIPNGIGWAHPGIIVFSDPMGWAQRAVHSPKIIPYRHLVSLHPTRTFTI